MKAEIEGRLRRFIIDTFLFGQGGDDLSSTDSLLDRGIVDSTGVLEVVSFVEESYGVSVVNEEILPANFETIERVATFVARKVGEPRSAA
mgnify:CR=1 FL=1